METTYRPILGFPGYRVGSDGTLWSCWWTKGSGRGRAMFKVMSEQWRLLKPSARPEDGRGRYTLKSVDGSYVRRYGSYFVLLAFVGPGPDGMEACHNDGNCLNDAAANLRWDTSAANKADMKRHGTRKQGEQIHTAKLTREAVLEIRRVGYPLKQHAIRYGVTEALVCAILKRKVWKHV